MTTPDTVQERAVPEPTTPAASVNLTLDGTLDDYRVRPGAMRWVPPERAAEIRASRRPDRAAKPQRTHEEARRG